MDKNKRLLSLVALMFLFSFFIAWNVPYTHDDWDWGRETGVINWLTGRYNNRYVGTFFVIVMTRFPLVKVLVMALTMTVLPLLCTYLALDRAVPTRRAFYLYILSYFVVFAMPVITWRQTYGWVAGFSNFTMGSLFLLLLLAALKFALDGNSRRPWILSGVCFLLGFVAQLCSENISVFLPLFLCASMVLLRIWKRRDLRTIFLAAFCGATLRALLMFFNPLYVNLATSGVSPEQFRTLTINPTDSVLQILETIITIFFCETLPTLYETHPILVLVLSAGAWVELRGKRKTASRVLGISMLLYGIFCCYCSYQMRWSYGWLPSSVVLRTAGAIVFTVLWLVSVLISPERHKWHVLAFSLFALALITPFAAIKNMGPRCYHISHFCFLAGSITRFSRLEFHRSGKLLICAALAVIMVNLTQAYAAIGACNVLREELTQQAVAEGATTLVLPSVDGEYTYSWGYNPQSALRAEHYREYYGLPENMELIFLPYGSAELWPDIPEEMYQNAMIYPGQ